MRSRADDHCDLCAELQVQQRVDYQEPELPPSGPPPAHPPPPVPESWMRLSTVAVLASPDWNDRWEVRKCPFCGAYYEYRQVHEERDVLRPESRFWTLNPVSAQRAATLIAESRR